VLLQLVACTHTSCGACMCVCALQCMWQCVLQCIAVYAAVYIAVYFTVCCCIWVRALIPACGTYMCVCALQCVLQCIGAICGMLSYLRAAHACVCARCSLCYSVWCSVLQCMLLVYVAVYVAACVAVYVAVYVAACVAVHDAVHVAAYVAVCCCNLCGVHTYLVRRVQVYLYCLV